MRTPRAARAQLVRHRAAAARKQGLEIGYARAGGGRLGIRWGRAGAVPVGAITNLLGHGRGRPRAAGAAAVPAA
jgi:hypothetical protein